MDHIVQQPDAQEAQSDVDSGEPTELSLNTTFELLKNRRRRDTLEYLIEHDGESTLSDLAEHIAAIENGIDVAQLSSDQRKRVYIGLYQCHLPKMDAASVIDFDKNRGTVVLREEAKQLVPYLEAEDDQETADEPERTDSATAGLEVEIDLVDLVVSSGIAAVVGLAGLAGLLPSLGGVAWFGAVLGVALVALVATVRRSVTGVQTEALDHTSADAGE